MAAADHVHGPADIIMSRGGRLLGRSPNNLTGNAEEITLGTNLSMTGRVLNAIGGSGSGGVPTTRSINTTAPLSGGGDLSADRTLSVADATTAAKGVVELATNGENAANVVVQGNDSRLSDNRTPLPHSHVEGDLILSDNTTNNVATTKHGFCPKLPNNAAVYLDGTGAYSTPTASLPSFVSALRVQASDVTLTANYGAVAPDDYEIGAGFFFELASGGVLEIA